MRLTHFKAVSDCGETCTEFSSADKMNSSKAQKHSGKFTITLFGEKPDLMNKIEETILEGDATVVAIPNFELRENASFRIISATNFFDEECPNPDQKIIDFMALSYPGPDQFILAIESENAQEDKVVDQITKHLEIFGDDVTKNVVIVSENQESHNSLERMKDMFNVQMTTVDKNLASELKEWSLKHQPFQFNYKNYSKDIVKRRKKKLGRIRNGFLPQNDLQTTGGGAHSSLETVFNIVLLGKSGTGKSASANTILAVGNSQNSIFSALGIGNSQQDSSQHFASYPSSTPVTTKCEVKMMKAGAQFAVVDTPDFFYEEEHVLKAQLEECKKYCQPERCVVLLVVQLGRFTEGERGILEKLEEHLGWKIRDHTIVLFTHGEDLNVDMKKFISERSHLKHIVDACGGRHHVFKNTTKDSKQAIELINKFPRCFPNFPTKHQSSPCRLS